MLLLRSGMVAGGRSFAWWLGWSKYSARSCRHWGEGSDGRVNFNQTATTLAFYKLSGCRFSLLPHDHVDAPTRFVIMVAKFIWDRLNFLREIWGRSGYKNFPPMSWSCLLAFGIRLWPAWLLSQYISPGPPKKHRCFVLKLDTVSTGFLFSWRGLAEYNSLTRQCEHCWSRCY